MAKTARILVSLHGKKVGLDNRGNLVVGGKTVSAQDDTGVAQKTQGAPSTLNATGALTPALVGAGIVTSTTGAGVTATLSVGTDFTTAFGADIAIGEAFDWHVINTGGNTFTVTQNTDHTVVGAGAVATATSAQFRTRRTAATTWITYRI